MIFDQMLVCYIRCIYFSDVASHLFALFCLEETLICEIGWGLMTSVSLSLSCNCSWNAETNNMDKQDEL